jgi:hypothetical protein
MKVLAAVLAFIAVASAQNFNTDAQNNWAIVGYPNNFAVVKAGADASGFFHVDPLVRPAIMPGDGRRACMRIMTKVTSPAAGATTWYAASYMEGEGAARAPTDQDRKLAIDLSATVRTGSDNFDFTPTTNSTPTAYAWPNGVALLAKVAKCDACIKTTELTVSAIIGWCTGVGCCTPTPPATPAITWGPFLAVDDRNTWTFDATPAAPAFSTMPPSILISSASMQGKPTYFLISPDKSTDSVSLVVYNSKATKPANPTDVQDNRSVDIKALPLGAKRNGDFRSGPVTLDTTTNYMAAPFVNGGATWTVAVGFGHEPAAAAGLVPSFLVAALLAVVALLL